MNSDGEIIELPEGENPGPGWIRLPELPDRFAEEEAIPQLSRWEFRRRFGMSRMEAAIAAAARRR